MKRIVSFFITSFLLGAFLVGQQIPKHPMKVYVSPDGKLFVSKALPIYLWLSVSPDEDAQKYRLRSTETPAYANPMYFDTEGYNTVRSPSCVDTVTRKTVYPEQDIIFEVYSDSEAPTTKLTFGDTKTYKKDGKIYVGSTAQLVLTATDAQSGVEQILISIDSGAFKPYTDPIPISQEKDYYIQFYAVDHVGNVEQLNTLKVVYDRTPPVTTKTVTGDEYESVLSGRTKIELTADDKGIGVQKIMYKINDGDEKEYQYPFNTANFAQKDYTIEYYAVDNVGNKEAVKTFSFYVDKTPPTIIEEVEGKSFFANGKEYSSGRARLKLLALDNKSGVKEIRYSINQGEFQSYDKPVMLTMASGNLSINSYAVDNVNNKSVSQAANKNTSIPYIDLTGPSLSNTFTGPIFNARDTVFINSKTKVVLKASDSESGMNRIEYQLDDNLLETYADPFTIATEGVHKINFTGYDNVENTSTSSITVKVDNTGPEIDTRFSTAVTNTGAYPEYVILFLSATDNVVGLDKITYQLNNTAAKTYVTPIKGFTKGEKSVGVTAYDMLQNQTNDTIRFNVE